MCLYFTQAPPPETKVNLHFVSIVQKEGHLYELGEECTYSTSRIVRQHSASVWGWVCSCRYVRNNTVHMEGVGWGEWHSVGLGL